MTTDPIENALVLPATALVGQSTVWVIERNQLARREITMLGEQQDGTRIVIAPIDIADGVVSVPPLEAREGQQVSIRGISPAVTAQTGGRTDGAQ